MLKSPKLVWLSCLLLLFIACSRNQTSTSTSPVQAQSSRDDYESNNEPANTLQDPASDRFVVPPEIAIMNAKISSTASSVVEANRLLELNSDNLAKKVTDVPGCSANMVNYDFPLDYSRKGISSKEEKYSGYIDFEILISFANAKDIKQRIKQVKNCSQVFSTLKMIESQQDENSNVDVVLSEIVPTIKDASKYRTKLLEAKIKPLQEVAALSNSASASQFNASDIKCTSKGIVQVVDRSLRDIELNVDFDCRRFVNGKLISEP